MQGPLIHVSFIDGLEYITTLAVSLCLKQLCSFQSNKTGSQAWHKAAWVDHEKSTCKMFESVKETINSISLFM